MVYGPMVYRLLSTIFSLPSRYPIMKPRNYLVVCFLLISSGAVAQKRPVAPIDVRVNVVNDSSERETGYVSFKFSFTNTSVEDLQMPALLILDDDSNNKRAHIIAEIIPIKLYPVESCPDDIAPVRGNICYFGRGGTSLQLPPGAACTKELLLYRKLENGEYRIRFKAEIVDINKTYLGETDWINVKVGERR